MLHKSDEGQQMCLVATAFSFRCPFPFPPDLCPAAQGCLTICTFQGEGVALRFSIASTLLRLKEPSFLLLLVAHLFPRSVGGGGTAPPALLLGMGMVCRIHVREYSISCCCGEVLGDVRG